MAHGKLRLNKKILCIDDNLENSYLIKRVLEADGYHVVLASNGSKGLVRANRERPCLILLDIHLTGLNSYEVVCQLRQMEQTKNTPILAFSTSTNPEDKELSFKVGCNAFISKPIDVDLISEQIAAYL